MNELVLVVLRAAVVVLLWLFVYGAIRTIGTDLWADRATKIRGRGARKAARQARKNAPRKLVVTAGPLTGTVISLGDSPVTIGRADASTLVLSDDFASNHHARVFLQGTNWCVEDLGSTNGTYLGPHRVLEPVPVPLGAPIRIGKTTLELRR